VISSVFKLAIVTLRAAGDPTIALHGALLPPKVQGRAAITMEQAFGKLLQAFDEYDGWPTIRAGLKFMILTCARPGEVRGARRKEFDLEKQPCGADENAAGA
jgi:integrase